jgi:pimeloyl-ACP methyl ester carboxylesterase
MASHRALRQLAVRLAQAGFAALRFDFYGCGDSEGASDAASLAQWLADLDAARQQLLQRRPRTRVAAVGLRLGASLALLSRVASGGPLVLWDPVVRGDTWLADLETISEENGRGATEDGVFGLTLTPAFRADLNQLDLMQVPTALDQPLLVIDGSQPRPNTAALVERLRASGAPVDYRNALYPPGWLDPGSAVVPGPMIQMVTKWLADSDQ